MLVQVPALAENASLGLVFLVGLLTSTHCIGMCGGILLAQTTDAHGVTGRSKRGLIASAAYNGGRVVSYTAVGTVCGALGAVITYTPNIKSMVFTVAGALVLLIGLRMAGILPGLRPSETELPGACSLNARTRRRFAGQPLIIGLLTGVMPCGALSAMWLYAMSSGSAVRGALVMLVFSLGTVPLLFLFGALQSFLPRGWMKYIVKGQRRAGRDAGAVDARQGHPPVWHVKKPPHRTSSCAGVSVSDISPASGHPRGSSRGGGTAGRWPSRSRPGARSRP